MCGIKDVSHLSELLVSISTNTEYGWLYSEKKYMYLKKDIDKLWLQ